MPALRALLTFFTFAFLGTAALACPDPRLYGMTSSLHGSDLYNPQTVSVQAGGDQQIANCAIKFGSDRGTGWVTKAPDFSVELSGMGSYRLEASVVSECDAILLINTGSVNWYYDDDDNGNYDPKITLNRPSNGWLDIWVGTHDGTVCDALLTLETFNR